jgi:hypothetical protein
MRILSGLVLEDHLKDVFEAGGADPPLSQEGPGRTLAFDHTLPKR